MTLLLSLQVGRHMLLVGLETSMGFKVSRRMLWLGPFFAECYIA